MISLLPILLSSAQPASLPQQSGASRGARAVIGVSAQIVKAERISFRDSESAGDAQTKRQDAQRSVNKRQIIVEFH